MPPRIQSMSSGGNPYHEFPMHPAMRHSWNTVLTLLIYRGCTKAAGTTGAAELSFDLATSWTSCANLLFSAPACAASAPEDSWLGLSRKNSAQSTRFQPTCEQHIEIILTLMPSTPRNLVDSEGIHACFTPTWYMHNQSPSTITHLPGSVHKCASHQKNIPANDDARKCNRQRALPNVLTSAANGVPAKHCCMVHFKGCLSLH